MQHMSTEIDMFGCVQLAGGQWSPFSVSHKQKSPSSQSSQTLISGHLLGPALQMYLQFSSCSIAAQLCIICYAQTELT